MEVQVHHRTSNLSNNALLLSTYLSFLATHFSCKSNDCTWQCSATLIFEVELVACRPRKGASMGSVSDEKARLMYIFCCTLLYIIS